MQQVQKGANTPKPIRRKKYAKIFLKGIFFIIASAVVLNVILYALLSIPAIQQKVLSFALGKIKNITKTEVRIDEIRLTLFNSATLRGVYIEDLAKDTLIYADNLSVSLSPLELLKSKLLIKEIELDNFTANISQQTPDSDFNYQFLIDAFAGDSTTTDSNTNNLLVDIENIDLKNGKLKYNILSEPATYGKFNTSHIYISDLNANLKLPSVNLADFDATIAALSFKEQSGLEVKNLMAKITSCKTTFFVRDAELHLPKSTLKVTEGQYNLLTKEFKLDTDRSLFSASDLLPLSKNLKYIKEDIFFRTHLSGKLPSVNIDNLTLDYGDKTGLKASAFISDYSHYERADLKLNIENFRITPDAITDFARIGDSTFIAPDILKTLGSIRLEGTLEGQLDKLNIKAEAWAKQGAIQLLASAATDTAFANFSTKAKLQTQNFNLGSLLEMPELGRLSGDIDLEVLQTAKQSLKADMKGRVLDLQYNKESYSNIPFAAYYSADKMGGWLNADMPQGKVEAKLDMTREKNPRVELDMNIQNLRTDAFFPVEEWKNPKLSMHMKGSVKGTDLRNIEADVVLEDFEFSHDSLFFKPGTMTLQAGKSDSAENYINLKTSFLKADIAGDYDFMTIENEFSNMMNHYLPGLFKKTLRTNVGKNNFDIHISVQNTEELARVLDLPVNIIEPLVVNGTVNTIDNKLNLTARIPRLQYDDTEFSGTELNVVNTDSAIHIDGKSSLIADSGNIKLNLYNTVSSDTVNTELAVKRDSAELQINTLFKALTHFRFNSKGEIVSDVQFSPTVLDIGKLSLSFMPAHIVNERNKTSISNFGFRVGKDGVSNNFFSIEGVISDQSTDTLNVSFFNSNLEYLLKAFDVDNISAVANGDIRISSTLNKPKLYTENMSLSDIIIFSDTLGTLNVKSRWNETARAISLDASLSKDNNKIKSTISGWIYPKQDSLDLKINLDRLSLAWIQPFVPDLLNRISGSISTGLTAVGKIDTPAVSGWLGVNDTYIGIDYTNVTYRISDTIKISPGKIGFDNLIVEDPNKNKARINTLITYKDFENIHYTLNANLTNFMVLNTESRTDSLFYGKIFATGNVDIKGSDELIEMNMKVRNGKNSKLNIQIPQASEASIYKSIVYINTPVDETTKTEVVEKPKDALPIKLNLNLTVTPDLSLGVVINPLTGDYMQIKGSGLIDYYYDMKSEDMRAIGNYILSDGSVKLKLQNLASIEFRIREGSKLVFNGDPMQTNFDITAYKRVKADLTVLDAGFGSDQYNSTRAYVDCILGIKGNINKMDLTYDISLPESSDDIQQRVRALVATNEQKVKQFAYLVATNSFCPQGNSDSSGNLTQGLLTNVATGAIGNILNSALGKMIGGDWEVGANVSSEDGTFSNMDMTVSLSHKFLDNKLEFNTNLGYRTDQASSNQFIGDFDVAYALTRAIKLKVFNKTNDRYYKQASTTQGIGIVYTKEAKTIKELFRFVRKKRNRTKPEQATTSK